MCVNVFKGACNMYKLVIYIIIYCVQCVIVYIIDVSEITSLHNLFISI